MKYTIGFEKKASKKLYNQIYNTLDLVFGYALGGYVLRDGENLKNYVLESDEDAECELDRILEEVGGVFGVELYYESADGDEEEEE